MLLSTQWHLLALLHQCSYRAILISVRLSQVDCFIQNMNLFLDKSICMRNYISIVIVVHFPIKTNATHSWMILYLGPNKVIIWSCSGLSLCILNKVLAILYKQPFLPLSQGSVYFSSNPFLKFTFVNMVLNWCILSIAVWECMAPPWIRLPSWVSQ